VLINTIAIGGFQVTERLAASKLGKCVLERDTILEARTVLIS